MTEHATYKTGENKDDRPSDNSSEKTLLEEQKSLENIDEQVVNESPVTHLTAVSTESKTDSDEAAANDNRHQTWGAQLRSGREKMQLSREDVSEKLFLELNIVEAMEAEDYHRLPPDSYVQGYLRNYAKFLNLELDPILESYKKQTGADSPVILPQVKHVDKSEELSSNSPFIKIITAIIILGILTLTIWGWQQGAPDYLSFLPLNNTAAPTSFEDAVIPPAPDKQIQPAITTTSSETPTETNANLLLPLPDTAASVPETELLPTTEQQNPPTLINNDAPVVNTNDNNEADAVALETPTDNPANDVSTVARNVESNVELQDTSLPDINDANILILQIQGESWLEAYDANNKRLFYQLHPGGETVTLTGMPPFKLAIGRSDAVIVKYSGEIIDLSAYKGRVANITVGAPRGE